jgi:hypothetical protein
MLSLDQDSIKPDFQLSGLLFILLGLFDHMIKRFCITKLEAQPEHSNDQVNPE